MISLFSMNINKRNDKIKSSKLSIQELSDKYGISYERVRQIIRKNKNADKQKFVTIAKEYQKNVYKIIETDINKEIKRLSNKGRNKFIILQKVILIRALKNHYKMSLYRIAKLFGNNYGTILHLYKSYNLKEKMSQNLDLK